MTLGTRHGRASLAKQGQVLRGLKTAVVVSLGCGDVVRKVFLVSILKFWGSLLAVFSAILFLPGIYCCTSSSSNLVCLFPIFVCGCVSTLSLVISLRRFIYKRLVLFSFAVRSSLFQVINSFLHNQDKKLKLVNRSKTRGLRLNYWRSIDGQWLFKSFLISSFLCV